MASSLRTKRSAELSYTPAPQEQFTSRPSPSREGSAAYHPPENRVGPPPAPQARGAGRRSGPALHLKGQSVIDEQQGVHSDVSQPPIERAGVESGSRRNYRHSHKDPPDPTTPGRCRRGRSRSAGRALLLTDAPGDTRHRNDRRRLGRATLRLLAAETQPRGLVSAGLLGDQIPSPSHQDDKESDHQSGHDRDQYTNPHGAEGLPPCRVTHKSGTVPPPAASYGSLLLVPPTVSTHPTCLRSSPVAGSGR